jgi:type IV pilus assembly protein PilC
MPTFQFEAMDATGQEIVDVIDAATEEEAQTTIRQMGYFVTKISVKKAAAGQAAGKGKKKRGFALGGGGSKFVCAFTRQLSILQDAGLPILRSLKILENNAKPGKLKNALLDTCEEIETGATLSEAMSKCPKVFTRLYVNMIKAGEAGGALEVVLQRLAEFMERSETLKKKVKSAMIYPCVVIFVAVAILTFIMWKIVPVFATMFVEFDLDLPPMTLLLVAISEFVLNFWFLLPAVPVGVFLFVKLMRKFKHGRMGWDMFVLRLPIMGMLIEKNTLARTTRTLGTLISSGVPILEGLNITRETAGNALFEKIYGKVTDSIREGNTVARPLKDYSALGFHPMCAFFWFFFGAIPGMMIMCLTPMKDMGGMLRIGAYVAGAVGVLCMLWYVTKIKQRVVDDLVVNMVDVGEETGELDTMLYKVADQYDEEVKTLTDGLMALLEPLMIVFLGGAVGFIVISLFMPLVDLIQGLS